MCNGTASVEVHHILPFHLFPEFELSPENLLTLCESKKYGVNCHLFFGHLGNYRTYNRSVIPMANYWRKQLKKEKEEDEKDV